MFKKGDKVKVRRGGLKGEIGEFIKILEKTPECVEGGKLCLVKGDNFNTYFFTGDLELVSIEREPYNRDKEKTLLNSLYGNDESSHYCDTDSVNNIFKPNHYQTKNGDLFDEWYERYYNDEKMYTGKEVFSEIMKAVAERYIRRYPNKNAEDIDKGVYTLIRLKEYTNKEVTK